VIPNTKGEIVDKIERNKRLHLELETVSKDRFQQQEEIEQLRQRLDDHTDDPDFEVGDALPDKPTDHERRLADERERKRILGTDSRPIKVISEIAVDAPADKRLADPNG
jgi:hypothetical protein